MKPGRGANHSISVRLRPLATALTLACLCLITLFTALQANSPASGPFPIVTVILQEGDTPAGGNGLPVNSLNPPVTNGNGQVGFSGTLDNAGDDTEFIWYDTGLIWLSSSVISDVSGIEPVIGISNNSNYAMSLNLNPGAVDSLWTDEGLLLSEGDPAPANPGYFITTLSHPTMQTPTMQTNVSVNWFAGISDTPGGTTQFEVLYHASDVSTPIIAPVLQGGEIISGFTIADTGLDTDYFVSDDGNHFITAIQTTEPFTEDDFIYLDGSLLLREGDPTGEGDDWDNFDLFQVNNSGHYLVSGDTNGAASSDDFIAYNGLIQVREGDTIGGVTLSSSASVRQVGLNNLGQAIYIWSILTGQEILFFACDASDLADATAVLATDNQVDTDGDGVADATITDFNTSFATQGFSLAEDGQIYVAVDLDYGTGPLEAIIRFGLPSCTGNTAPTAVADDYTTGQVTPLVVPAPGVLANDLDAEGDPLTAVLIQSTISGSLDLNASGAFTYTPDLGFLGGDSFTYRAHDGTTFSNLATVFITVTSDNPDTGFVVTPAALESTQPADTLLTQTVTLSPTAGTNINWVIGDTPIITYSNGPLINLPGGGPNGADASMLQVSGLGMSGLGFGNSVANNNRIADEFTVTGPDGWLLDNVTFYAYQTGSPITSTMTAVNFRLWDGPPHAPTSTILFGDTDTNRLLHTGWSGVYRVTDIQDPLEENRPIMANSTGVGVYLPPATYWFDWQTDGSLSSGPWAPPIVISNVTTTGNGLQLNSGVWVDVTDSGTGAPQGFPFDIENCALPPWVTVNPTGGTLTAGTTEQLTVTFDSTGLAAGAYTGTLCLANTETAAPFVPVPLTLNIGTPAIILTQTVGTNSFNCADESNIAVPLGTEVYYCFRVTNSGQVPLTTHDLTDSESGVVLSNYMRTLAPGASFNTVAVGITRTAHIVTNTTNTAVWTATNGPRIMATATATATVTAIQLRTIYVPFVIRP